MSRDLNIPVIIIGGGGHCSVLLDLLSLTHMKVAGVVDRQTTTRQLGVDILGGDEAVERFDASAVHLVNGIGSVGSTENRRRVFETFRAKDYRFPILIHPSAVVSSRATLADGAQIMAGVVIQASASIASNVLINTGASIDHDCVIGEHVHVAPGAVLSGGVTIGSGTHVGTGAVIVQNIRVGKRVIIGAGMTVLADVPDGAVLKARDGAVWNGNN